MERASLADALVVPVGKLANDIRPLHFHAELLLGEVDGRENGQIGIAFAATGTTDSPDFAQ